MPTRRVAMRGEQTPCTRWHRFDFSGAARAVASSGANRDWTAAGTINTTRSDPHRIGSALGSQEHAARRFDALTIDPAATRVIRVAASAGIPRPASATRNRTHRHRPHRRRGARRFRLRAARRYGRRQRTGRSRPGALPIVTCASPAYIARHGMPEKLGDLDAHRLVHYVSTLGTRPPGFEHPTVDGYRTRPMHGVISVNSAEACVSACLIDRGLIQAPRTTVAPPLDEASSKCCRNSSPTRCP